MALSKQAQQWLARTASATSRFVEASYRIANIGDVHDYGTFRPDGKVRDMAVEKNRHQTGSKDNSRKWDVEPSLVHEKPDRKGNPQPMQEFGYSAQAHAAEELHSAVTELNDIITTKLTALKTTLSLRYAKVRHLLQGIADSFPEEETFRHPNLAPGQKQPTDPNHPKFMPITDNAPLPGGAMLGSAARNLLASMPKSVSNIAAVIHWTQTVKSQIEQKMQELQQAGNPTEQGGALRGVWPEDKNRQWGFPQRPSENPAVAKPKTPAKPAVPPLSATGGAKIVGRFYKAASSRSWGWKLA